mmetsp:Transcript_36686/g.84405  ORF Transcript_36686/g.84405 Transcript_36686/m.84405 type:complete len:147 (+) Transcript_36686:46-486(+)
MGVSPSQGSGVFGPMAACCGSCKVVTQQSRARDSVGKSLNQPNEHTITACATGDSESYDPDPETLNDPFLFQGTTADVEPDSSSASEVDIPVLRWRASRPGPTGSETSQSTCGSEDAKPHAVKAAVEGDRPRRIGAVPCGQTSRKV